MNVHFFTYNGLVVSNGTEIAMPDIGQPWPVPESSVTTMNLADFLCRVEGRNTFWHVLKELYRVAAPGCTIKMALPHPRHDSFFLDPDYVRPLLTDTLREFEFDAFKNPLSARLGVDFRVTDEEVEYEEYWTRVPDMTPESLLVIGAQANNVIRTQKLTWVVAKPPVSP